MFKQIVWVMFILTTMAAAACAPAGFELQGEGQVTVGDKDASQTPAPTAAPTHTQPPAPTSPPATSEIQVQVEGGGQVTVTNGLEGTWQITDFSSGAVSLLGSADAQAYVGKQATIASSSISFDGQTCADVTFARHSASLSAFLGTGFATVMADLGITQEQVDVIETTCGAAGFNSFVQVDPNTLIVNINGTFFVFRK